MEAVMDDVRREQIGIVGVGNMGGAIGRSMLREGINLTAFDVNETARSAIAELGATIAPTLDALARTCKVISIVVVTDEQVRHVGQQIVSKARPGTIVLIHSTTRPRSAPNGKSRSSTYRSTAATRRPHSGRSP